MSSYPVSFRKTRAFGYIIGYRCGFGEDGNIAAFQLDIDATPADLF
jgi:hypothetical protein